MSVVNAVKRFFTGKPVFPKPSVAVEIGADWIKIAQASSGFRSGKISRLGCQAVTGKDGAESALRQLIAETGCETKDMILCLPRNQVAVRMLRVPATHPEEISKIVHLQAGRLTPYSSDEVVSAYDILGTDEHGYSTVLLAIARRRLISEKSALIAACGGRVGAVAAGTEGVCAQVRRIVGKDVGADVPTGVLNVDADFSELIVFYNGAPVFTKNVLIGSAALKKDVARWQGELINEIVTGVDEFKKDYASAPDVPELIFTGMAVPSSLAAALKEVCGICVTPAELGGPGGASGRKGDADISPASVVGCALSGDRLGVDLLPPEDHLMKVMTRRRGQLNVMGVLGLFIVTLLLALLVLGFYERHLRVESLKRQVGGIEPVAELVRERQRRVAIMGARLDAAGTPLHVLTELQRLTPDEIHLTSLKVDAKDTMSLRGQAVAMNNIFEYGKILENSKVFEGVDSSSSVGKNNQFAEFTITCRFQKPMTTFKTDKR
ncbi:MAG: PilN domain-containing protein [Lentisphaeria bacterium]|nr:PilN domain-containing protein [Lentisphaeria bacterium]